MPLGRWLAERIDSVRINDVLLKRSTGWSRWVKSRRPGMGPVIACGNVFLRASHSRILMFPRAADWRDWELTCFRLLNGPTAECGSDAPSRLWFDELPGRRLADLARDGALGLDAVTAAAAELKRAHALGFPALGGTWSHGDPHLSNILFDAAAGRCRLLDFEARHEAGLPALERRADDLLVFLLDLSGKVAEAGLPPLAAAFVRAYGDSQATARLRERLRPPRGWEAVLWQTRSGCPDRGTLDRRVRLLHAATGGPG